jgi:hypothetical protein
MKKTFCDICGIEVGVSSESGDSLSGVFVRGADKYRISTSVYRRNLADKVMPKKPVDICRACALGAIKEAFEC